MQYPERQLLGQYQCVPVKLHQQCLGANGGRNLVHIFSPLDSSGSAKGVFYCVHHCTPNPESTEGRPWGQPLKKAEGAPLNLG